MFQQDYLMKFSQLKALKTKKWAEGVVYHLLEEFTIFRTPYILQSDNNREFVNKILKEVCGIYYSPYEVLFSCKAKVDLKTYLPVDSLIWDSNLNWG